MDHNKVHLNDYRLSCISYLDYPRLGTLEAQHEMGIVVKVIY